MGKPIDDSYVDRLLKGDRKDLNPKERGFMILVDRLMASAKKHEALLKRERSSFAEVYGCWNVTSVANAAAPHTQYVYIPGVKRGMMSMAELCGSESSPLILSSVCEDGRVALKFGSDPGAGALVKLTVLQGSSKPKSVSASLT
jgi:hypothetical protein